MLRLLVRRQAGSRNTCKQLSMLYQLASFSSGVSSLAVPSLHLQQHCCPRPNGSHTTVYSTARAFTAPQLQLRFHTSRVHKQTRHIASSVAARAPSIKPKWDTETAKKALASLAQEPTEFAKGVEVLDSIVKVYTVYSR